MNDASSTQGWAICTAAGLLALLFLIGVWNGSYLALALPVGALTLFVLGLAGWVGYTIATVRVEPASDPKLQSPASPAPSESESGSKSESESESDSNRPERDRSGG